jgi:hypothetical protein
MTKPFSDDDYEHLGLHLLPGFLDSRIFVELATPPGGGPIRTLTERPAGRPMGRFQSAKAGFSLPWVDYVQRDRYWFCEASPDVAAYMAQPHRVTFRLPKKDRVFFPDLRIEWRTGKVRIERLIPPRGVSDAEWESIAWARAVYERRGWEFAVLHHRDVVGTIVAKNAVEIASDAFTVVTVRDLDRAFAAMDRLGQSATYRAIIDAMGGPGLGRALVHALIMDGHLWIDLTKPLRRFSPVRLAATGRAGP